MPNQITLSSTASIAAAPATRPAPADAPPPARSTVLELRVRNHPGTMSHITGLFARRGFNLDAIVCVPIADGTTSLIRLLAADDSRLEQLERQLTKLHDVLDLRHRDDLGPAYFARIAAE